MYAKVIKALFWVLFVGLIILFGLCALMGLTDKNELGVQLPTIWTSLLITVSTVMVLLPIGIIIVLGIILGAMNNPKGLLKIILFALGFVVIVAATYFLASGDPVPLAHGTDATPFSFKLADTALYVIYIALGGVILSLIIGAIYRLIKG